MTKPKTYLSKRAQGSDFRHETKYTGKLPNFSGYYRCNTGEGRAQILVRHDRLEKAKIKYPNLQIINIEP